METRKERLIRTFSTAVTEEECDAIMDASRANESWNVWDHNGKWLYFEDGDEFDIECELEGRTEIPVTHFTDLLHDRIAPWRLEDDGFEFDSPFGYCYEPDPERFAVTIHLDPLIISVWTSGEGLAFEGITTYTDLITLIRLIG
jgi:hypothetical protein